MPKKISFEIAECDYEWIVQQAEYLGVRPKAIIQLAFSSFAEGLRRQGSCKGEAEYIRWLITEQLGRKTEERSDMTS